MGAGKFLRGLFSCQKSDFALFAPFRGHSISEFGFKPTPKGLALEPGDIMDVTHPEKPSWVAKLFRVEDLELDDEDRLKLKCSESLAACYT